MRILALDLAHHTGWARWDDGELQSGMMDFTLGADEHPGARLARVYDSLTALAVGPPVEVIAWERIVSYGGGGNSLSMLYAFESRVVELAWRIKAEPRTVAPPTLKKHATGDGRAKKPDMVAAAERRWPGVRIERHDQADALCVLAWALDEIGVTKGRA